MDANREALLAAARQLQTGESSSSEEDDDDGDDGGQAQIDAFRRSVASIQAQGAASSVSYFVQPQATSNVMGAEYIAPPFSSANWRDQEISRWEQSMTSQDRKRQIRQLLSLKFLHDDVMRQVATSPGMLPLNDLLARRDAVGHDQLARDWLTSQLGIRSAIDALKNEINNEISYVFLANDRGNKFGYGTIDRMKDFSRMEQLVPKPMLDLYSKAHSSMNTLK